MPATMTCDQLMFVERLKTKSWIFAKAVTTFDKVACSALDAADFSWGIIKDPVSGAVESVAFSNLGQFTIGCLETGVGVSANLLDTVVPGKEKSKLKIRQGDLDKEPNGEQSAEPGAVETNKITTIQERKGDRPRLSINTASTSLLLALRNLQDWLKSLKIDPDDDLCFQCAKRRKVIATRRMSPLHGLVHLSIGAVTAPLQLIGLNVHWDVLKCAVTVSGNDNLDKSPMRPKSATEKRKFERMTSSDEEDDDLRAFHDLSDYNSDEDADYALPEKDESSCSDEYVEGLTESDVSIDESSPPLNERAAKKRKDKTTKTAATTTTTKPGDKATTNKLNDKETTNKPDVKVTTNKPDVKITTNKPDVKITTNKPDVKVTTNKPDVKVTTNKPDSKMTNTPGKVTTTTKSGGNSPQIGQKNGTDKKKPSNQETKMAEKSKSNQPNSSKVDKKGTSSALPLPNAGKVTENTDVKKSSSGGFAY